VYFDFKNFIFGRAKVMIHDTLKKKRKEKKRKRKNWQILRTKTPLRKMGFSKLQTFCGLEIFPSIPEPIRFGGNQEADSSV
jgi:hypothetical protein